jgi:hypothetical protein
MYPKNFCKCYNISHPAQQYKERKKEEELQYKWNVLWKYQT